MNDYSNTLTVTGLQLRLHLQLQVTVSFTRYLVLWRLGEMMGIIYVFLKHGI